MLLQSKITNRKSAIIKPTVASAQAERDEGECLKWQKVY